MLYTILRALNSFVEEQCIYKPHQRFVISVIKLNKTLVNPNPCYSTPIKNSIPTERRRSSGNKTSFLWLEYF